MGCYRGGANEFGLDPGGECPDLPRHWSQVRMAWWGSRSTLSVTLLEICGYCSGHLIIRKAGTPYILVVAF